MAKEHLLISEKIRLRFMQHVDLNGPMHPYDPELGRCHTWTSNLSDLGYGCFAIMVGNKGQRKKGSFFAHRVAVALSGRVIPRQKVVMHSCDNRRCVNPAHLHVGTRSQNSQEMADRGRSAFQRDGINRGERHGSSKLSETDVLCILSDDRPHKELAAQYGVTSGQISHIKTGRSWGHLTCPDPSE